MKKWDTYSFTEKFSTKKSPFVYSGKTLTEGRVEPWDMGINPGMPAKLGGFSSGIRLTSLAYTPYCGILSNAYGVMGWRDRLATGRCAREDQIHEMRLVRLPRLRGDKVIHCVGAPGYHARGRGTCLENFVVPFFDTKGSCLHSHYMDIASANTAGVVQMTRPPRIVVRHLESDSGAHSYFTELSLGYHVLYIGKDTTRDKAIARARQLVVDCMISPEDVPETVKTYLNREHYGLVFGKALPVKEQMILSDYWLALAIVGWSRPTRAGSLTEKFRRSLWEDPDTAMYDAVQNPISTYSCYGGCSYKEAQKGIKLLLPLLTGKYTKPLARIFRKAAAVTEAEYEVRGLQRVSFGSFIY